MTTSSALEAKLSSFTKEVCSMVSSLCVFIHTGLKRARTEGKQCHAKTMKRKKN
jgi:hypothetical protein